MSSLRTAFVSRPRLSAIALLGGLLLLLRPARR